MTRRANFNEARRLFSQRGQEGGRAFRKNVSGRSELVYSHCKAKTICVVTCRSVSRELGRQTRQQSNGEVSEEVEVIDWRWKGR